MRAARLAAHLHHLSPGGFVMAAPALVGAERPPALFHLIGLQALPCGCVAAAYQADPWNLGLISVETKGPHCFYVVHRPGRVLRLGRLEELIEDEEE
jgi:hypothetical protein